MSAQTVQPLRINKTTPLSPKSKMNGSGNPQPLSELSPVEGRRNSGNFKQTNKKGTANGDSSPFDSSPNTTASPRAFWQGHASSTAQNRLSFEKSTTGKEHSPSPMRRTSIENLKRASRVKNSSMFAREAKQDENVKLDNSKPPLSNHARQDLKPLEPLSPSRNQTSPTKSALSSNGRFGAALRTFDPERGNWSDDAASEDERKHPVSRIQRGYAKSVTFDAAPPQINEYEMTTPDLSVASSSREGSYDSVEDEEDDEEEGEDSYEEESAEDMDDSFDASLEDTDKTPVVEPDDWPHMSPQAAHARYDPHLEDPFDESASPAHIETIHERPTPTRSDSEGSNGDRRPLPPLPPPGLAPFARERSASTSSLSAAAERMRSFQRRTPSPPRPASATKAEIHSLQGNAMPLSERLQLMMLHDDGDRKQNADEPQKKKKEEEEEEEEEEPENGSNLPEEEDYQLPHISRESILQKVKDNSQHYSYDFSSPAPSSSPDRNLRDLDPDVPIPSLEESIVFDGNEEHHHSQHGNDEEQNDLIRYSIPENYRNRSESAFEDDNDDSGSVIHHDISDRDLTEEYEDDASQYSQQTAEAEPEQPSSDSTVEDEAPPTPTRRVSAERHTEGTEDKHKSLIDFDSFMNSEDFRIGFGSYMDDSTQQRLDHHEQTEQQMEQPQEILERPMTPADQLQPPNFSFEGQEDTPCTPDSVIHRPMHSDASPPPPPSNRLSIPDPIATIKAPGGKLKTRPSATPADMATLAATRRQVSGNYGAPPPRASSPEEVPAVPALPEKVETPINEEAQAGNRSDETESEDRVGDLKAQTNAKSLGEIEKPEAQLARKRSLMQLDIPVAGFAEGLTFGLDKEFDRVIENQKRGYLMRQNTKVIVASSKTEDSAPEAPERGTRSASSSPKKPTHERSQSWTTEPWNGKSRRRSIRQTSSAIQKAPLNSPAPPLPGTQSNVSGHVATTTTPVEEETAEEGSERGRLFIKVVGVKDLDLPLPKNERTWFCLTLDNGLHCVTTAWLELGKNAPIGQEFELVVLDELEFTLTLQTKLAEPVPQTIFDSPSRIPKSPKPSTFSRVFASPRKRKELDKKQQEEEQRLAAQRVQEANAKRRSVRITAWDLLHNLVGKDGSFARSYVCLGDHEKQAFGQAHTVTVPCFNEWAVDENAANSSVKSKRSNVGGAPKRPPYRIGKLELQLFYLPKPKNAQDSDMPKSMSACIRELEEARASAARTWEGVLTQQGGDCPYWRRRYFKLDGSKLTAYHETTRQPRATINLAKASRLIDDRSSLLQKEASGKGGSRRKSAFAEEEEGYMFVEEGFRIRFANGETIDFYADNPEQKEDWMKVLSEAVGKEGGGKRGWTDIVLAKERSAAKPPASTTKASPEKRLPIPTSSRSVPSTPSRGGAPVPVEKSPRHQPGTPRTTGHRPSKSVVF
ncbi:DUF1709-domain-containing protein [Xylona heveae TC161]|uniref:DUF1709-domain-containing protein n=1 Tax=Xylona heveae (strain CBS 132557 / TC161) TaxID=1328760 RepID=A0A165FZS2_XYLHT|nr:DUF1709-domain-containing protein [Xylona heveae TC161]KZF21575.1 DUF1709-domain-containing protein [Xylona heveae TC161]